MDIIRGYDLISPLNLCRNSQSVPISQESCNHLKHTSGLVESRNSRPCMYLCFSSVEMLIFQCLWVERCGCFSWALKHDYDVRKSWWIVIVDHIRLFSCKYDYSAFTIQAHEIPFAYVWFYGNFTIGHELRRDCYVNNISSSTGSENFLTYLIVRVTRAILNGDVTVGVRVCELLWLGGKEREREYVHCSLTLRYFVLSVVLVLIRTPKKLGKTTTTIIRLIRSAIVQTTLYLCSSAIRIWVVTIESEWENREI